MKSSKSKLQRKIEQNTTKNQGIIKINSYTCVSFFFLIPPQICSFYLDQCLQQPTQTSVFFPSYQQIHHSIIEQHRKQHQQNVNQLSTKISTLKKTFDLEHQHSEIKNKLLENYHSSNHDSMNNQDEKMEKQNDAWNLPTSAKSSHNTNSNNAYSLNYCIDDDIEEQNHYQNHLKFKKQVLERDLFQNVYWNGKHDKKKTHDEEYIFKNLYNQRPNTAYASCSSINKPRNNQKRNYVLSDNTKQFKQNIRQLKKSQSGRFKKYNPLTKISERRQNAGTQTANIKQNAPKKPCSYGPSSSTTKCARKQGSNQSQFCQQSTICLKNTKILKDSYGKYLKQLQGTNIIKWRILGGDKYKNKRKWQIILALMAVRQESQYPRFDEDYAKTQQ